MAKTPSVFISYSWDSLAHRKWVEGLARRLLRNGVQVWLDQWHVRPGESLTKFMETKIRSSGHVLVITTPLYAKKANKRIGGVGYEQQIISGRIAVGIPRRKFIPIIRSGKLKPGPKCAIPTHFEGIFALDMRAKRLSDQNVEALLRTIFNEPRLPKEPGKSDRGKLIRLPSLKRDGWHLRSGVVSNRKYPKTFWIPPEKQRNALKPGDLAKLDFLMRERDGNISGERMWVKITGNSGPYYLGDLSNHPISDQRMLRWGGPVVFLPEHVIDIVPLTKRKKRKA